MLKKTLILVIITLTCWNQSHAGYYSDPEKAKTKSIEISLILDKGLEGPVLFGIETLERNLNSRGLTVRSLNEPEASISDYFIIAGTSGSGGVAAQYLKVLNIDMPDSPEAFVIQRTKYEGTPALIISGSDETGLMYALLHVAEKIVISEKSGGLFSGIPDEIQKPAILDRSVSCYTMHRKNFEEFLHDDVHMEKFFEMLAMNRINSFAIVFGYENGGFMAPSYPYFFDVEGFPEVKMVGLSKDQQSKNFKAFKKLVSLANSHGIRVVPGFWDHIYRGKVQTGGVSGAPDKGDAGTPHLVVGVSSENLAEYNKAAITKFLNLFPEIDRIQFRMHWESGLTREETPGFWHDMLAVIKQNRPDIQLDLRAKGLPDVVIDDAISQDLEFRIATKYWMEQMGQPFHPTHVNIRNQKDRRHGYADLLTYPVKFPMQWRLWNGGTTRFLLWGDPEYVRRFVESTKIYEGSGFEVNQMLATKMLGEDHNAKPFKLLKPEKEYYEYEFERYWHFYQVWGRMSYNPDIPQSEWEEEFNSRFGQEAGKPLMEGLHLASKVLPRIVACSYPYRHFPTTRGWAEMHRQFDLPEYSKAEGSDIQQFMNMSDYAQMLMDGSATAMRTPLESSNWFRQTSDKILARVEEAEKANSVISQNEFVSTITDLKILAYLAKYHSKRLLAGTRYNLYLKTENPAELDEAIQLEEQAREAWSNIVEVFEEVYSKEIVFGVNQVGFPRNYREELDNLDEGLKALREIKIKGRKRKMSAMIPMDAKQIIQAGYPDVKLEKAELASPGKDLVIHANISDEHGIKRVLLRYRHLTQFEDYLSVEMKPDPVTGIYSAAIPGNFIISEWDLMYYVEAINEKGNGIMIPDMEEEMPYVVVKVSR